MPVSASPLPDFDEEQKAKGFVRRPIRWGGVASKIVTDPVVKKDAFGLPMQLVGDWPADTKPFIIITET